MIFLIRAHIAEKDQVRIESDVLQLCSRLLVHIGRFVCSSRALIVQSGLVSSLLNALDNYKAYSDPSQV